MRLRSLPVIATVLMAACSSQTSRNQNRDETNIRGLFGFGSRTRPPVITLRDGRTVDVKKYRIDAETKKFIEGIEKFQKLVSPVDLQSLTDTQRFWKKDWDSALQKAGNSGVTASELFGLREYTGGGYGEIKDYFDRQKELKPEQIKTAEAILLSGISALNKLPRYQGKVYFGACLSEQMFLPLLKPNELFWQNNFTSTSSDESVANIFASGCVQVRGEAAFHFTIEKSFSGATVSEFSIIPRENEVLFPPALSFRVKSIAPRVVDQAPESEYKHYDVVLEEPDLK